FWLLIGITAGILNLVPFVGPFVGGALAALVALVIDESVSQALWAVGLFTAIQQFDTHVVTPVVQRARVNLSPLVIVLARIAVGTLAGLLGVLVAVPTVTAVRIVAGHLWRTRVLGESWQQASDAMIEYTELPEGIARGRRPQGDQQRLVDTGEHPEIRITPESGPTSIRSRRGTPCASAGWRAAPRRCRRGRPGRSAGRSPGRRSTAPCWRSARP